MAVLAWVVSESHTGTVGSISEASFAWSHAGNSSTKGILVFVVGLVTSNDDALSIDYGGVDVPAVAGGFAQDTVSEPMSCKAFFLGSAVLGGTQTVTVTRNNNTNELWASAVDVTAAANTEVTGVSLLQEDGTLAQVNIDDGSLGANSQRFAGIASGLAAPPPVGANSTLNHDFDTGNQTAAVVRESVTGQGSRPVGFSSGTSDDRAAVHLAVREVVVAAPQVRPFDPVPETVSARWTVHRPTRCIRLCAGRDDD